MLENRQTIGFECFLTGDGKGMQVSNYSPVTKCWTCEDGDSLEPHDNATPMARWGAFLRAMRRIKRVGNCAHCVARLCNAIAKRLASHLSLQPYKHYSRQKRLLNKTVNFTFFLPSEALL